MLKRCTDKFGQLIKISAFTNNEAHYLSDFPSKLRSLIQYLSDHRKLLDMHNADGAKRNNAALQDSCKACHWMQPLHDHMYAPGNEMQLINEKRRAAGVLTRTWNCVSRYVDPASNSAIGLAKTGDWDAPQIVYQPSDCVESLEVDWSEKRHGMSLSQTQPQVSGWRIHDLSASIDYFANQRANRALIEPNGRH